MSEIDRRTFVTQAATVASTAALGLGCRKPDVAPPPAAGPSPVLAVQPLGSAPWPTEDPFLFCVHHDDAYPAGNENMGPSTSVAGRQLGQDFSGREGWSMYHGRVVPGFPRHPHRGFETVTVAERGFIDHSDSLGATARYGGGDTQWMTAGRGIVHAEMFPLRRTSDPNPLELFQIWLNLPAASKMVDPHFEMLWRETIPVHRFVDGEARATTVTTIAGALQGRTPPASPPQSWAANPTAGVAIWTVRMAPGARWTLPAGPAGAKRNLYFFEGGALRIAGDDIAPRQRVTLRADVDVPLTAGAAGARALILQGRPIGEPVARHGPFVMNERAQLAEAYADYRRDGFGGWPWGDDAPVHDRAHGRFAVHANGRRDTPKAG